MVGLVPPASSRNATYKIDMVKAEGVTEKKGKRVEHYEVLKLPKYSKLE